MTLSIRKQFDIDTDADELFRSLTTNFADVSSWASGIDSSDVNPKFAEVADGVPGGRICQVPGFGFIDEQLVRYDPSSRTFAYTADAEKIPGFVQNLKNTWTISSAGSGSTVTLNLTADVTGPIGAVMKPMMRRKFDKTLDSVGVDLKTYAETGRVSPQKSKELAKAAR